jgi:hypothetical protein
MEKLGPSQYQAEVERLKAAGKLPALDDVLGAVAEARKKYRPQILEAREEGKDAAEQDS